MSFLPCFASFIDENDTPILIHVLEDGKKDINDVLKFNVFSNISTDYFNSNLYNSLAMESNATIKNLFQLEGISVYGSIIKATGLKLIIGFKSTDIDEERIQDIVEKIKHIYMSVKLNPFIIADSNSGDQLLIEMLTKKLEEDLN
ncbi:hypothetical protein TPHA_0F03430 [Tetrapisispora phaffii CBS 4417]|uniref:Uncharacterized protein n=1 Tax=Tetrapisispora phaffii (strain ATCC 24235 / CBS 4417 / NBRC 1672 / NRRL Y-8282 / UCD 70-5) TaxID=1071381 RepID=G8BUN7_TETPH|nr:hypothetical protein TPHA_0F03430 [Tetrapisispora phaffii CBS 4417]CCE63823.1 hypothetical protein TPHA_0F03430 [Tetrapisispora phaffii CBS 4417]